MSGTAYARPNSLDEALSLLASGRRCVAAGCTDLFPATERKILSGPVLDISAITALRGISQTSNGVTIGAATTWSDIHTANLPPACYGLQRAAREVGGLQIQNRGTIGGNLCNASPAADGVPALLTLDAEVELASVQGTRRLAVPEFLLGPRQTALNADEILTAIHIPLYALAGESFFLKLGARSSLVISIAMVAVRVVIEEGAISSAALSVGACGPVATRLPNVEAAFIGKPLDPHLVQDADVASALSPIEDIRADAAYRATAAAELVRRAVAEMKDRGS